jgi:uncharacterized protein YbjT (DUF2867 family)
MYVILGAPGHIGREVVRELSESGEKVIAVTRTQEQASEVTADNVEGIAQDILDTKALKAVLAMGKRAFLLNPPAPPTSDTDAEELRTAYSISAALIGSGLEKVVVASTYGAQPGSRIGDLSVLYDLERSVEASGIPTAINRGAYYFTNFDAMLESARQGILPTPFPADLAIPTVSPIDLGKAAARRLTSSIEDAGIEYVEGPSRHTMADVAAIFSDVLERRIRLQQIPRAEIEQSFLDLGFSSEAADAYATMTKATIDGPELPDQFVRGDVSLRQHLQSKL